MNRPIKGPKPEQEGNPQPNEEIQEELPNGGNNTLNDSDDNLFGDFEDPGDFPQEEDDIPDVDTPYPPEVTSEEEEEINEEYKYEYDPNRSYLFIFGPPAAGKTVLIGSIVNYLNSTRSERYGDTPLVKNDINKKHELQGNILLQKLEEANIEAKFPPPTQQIEGARQHLNMPVPRHINLLLQTNSKLPDFDFCFMDLAGEDCTKLEYESGGKLHWSIKTYIEHVPKENICFIYIIDPKCKDRNVVQQTALFNAFINTLDSNNHTSTPLLILVSKWDLYKDSYKNVEEYLRTNFNNVWGKANQRSRNISIAEFSIGEVEKTENEKIINFDETYSERVFNWFYENQTGYNLLKDNDVKPVESVWKKVLSLFR